MSSITKRISVIAVIIGGTVGGALSFFLTSKDGRGKLNNLLKKAEEFLTGKTKAEDTGSIDSNLGGDDLVSKARLLNTLNSQKHSGLRGKLEKEVSSIKSAVKTAVNTYKYEKAGGATVPNIMEEILSDSSAELEDETLPKFESMRKRKS